MAELAAFQRAVADFADVADFVSVYISEVHPSDGWDIIGNRYEITIIFAM